MKIAITGVSGFIASHLAERCIKEGHLVRGICRKPESVSWLKKQGVDVVSGDLLDYNSLEDNLKDTEIVIHAAGWGGDFGVPEELAWNTNVEGTQNVINAAHRHGIKKLIYISSVAVYGVNFSPLLTENAKITKVGELYSDSKIEAEKMIRTSEIPFVIVRPGSIYGPRGKGWSVAVINAMKSGAFVYGNGSGKITPGYIENFIDAMMLCIDKEEALGKTFNICDDKVITYTEYYAYYAKMLNKTDIPHISKFKIIVAKSKVASFLRTIIGRKKVGAWSNHFRFNPSQYSIDEIKSVLGYKPKVSFDEGIRLTEEWLRNNNYIN